jgi:dTDP-4-dehydrorhamnose reductase
MNSHSISSRPGQPPVWITGAGGLIGNYLLQTATRFAPGRRVRGLTRKDLDLTDFDVVRNEFKKDLPALLIHCAALTQTPACQSNPALAQKANVEATAALAEMAADIPFIFFSTDLVFDGRKGNYSETETPNPTNIYAATKLAAEQIVLSNPRHTVVRTSLNFGVSPTGDRGFNEQMAHAWRRGETLRLFTDEFRCPIPAAVTARAVWEIAVKNLTGLFHVAGSEKLSRWEIGQRLAGRRAELNPKIEPDTLANYRGAPRSPDTSLNCAKVQEFLSFRLPGLTDWLAANPDEPL